MSDNDFDAIFNEENEHNETPEVQFDEQHEAEQEAAQEAENEPENEDTVTETEQAQEPLVEQVEEQEQRHVPLPTFLDMRDKMKEQKAAAEAAQRELDDYRRQVTETFQTPDPNSDPLGFARMIEQQVEQKLWFAKVEHSRALAEEKHGRETVERVDAWAASREGVDPQFAQQLVQQANPFEWAIQQHKAATILEEFQRDPIAAAKRIAEEQGWFATGATQVAPTTATKTERKLPKSLTDVPAANPATKATTVSDKEEFDAIFNRRT